MNISEIIEAINDDREENEQLKPSKLFNQVVELDTKIDEYGQELERVNDKIYDMSFRMREDGFDGDFDPNASRKKRHEEIQIITQALRGKISGMEKNFTEADRELEEEIQDFRRCEWENDDMSRQERACGC